MFNVCKHYYCSIASYYLEKDGMVSYEEMVKGIIRKVQIEIRVIHFTVTFHIQDKIASSILGLIMLTLLLTNDSEDHLR